jgi:uncharacterized protein
MARVKLRADLDLDSPTLVEGLPGAGLVGKIAADHLVDQFDMAHVASVHCDGLPPVAVYRGNDSTTMPPVRLYADEERDLLVLQSDVPVSPSSADDFAACCIGWFVEHDVLPLCLSGLPGGKDGVPEVYGISIGDADGYLDDAGVVPPREAGLVSGPTGALLNEALEREFPAIGLVTETEAKFPDPEAARAVLDHGIAPIAGIDVETEDLVEQAEEIQDAREQLAQQIQDGGDESSEAQPIRGFQ